MIEIFKGFYAHWAVYVGDGFIVHMAPALANVPGACADSLMSVRNKKALVKKEKLRDVVGKAKWRINNRQDKTYKPRPAEDIVTDACARVGETLYYSVFQNNCEHFAKELRYGIAKSRQVLAGAAMISGSVLMASSIFVLPAFLIGAPLYVYSFVLSW